MMNPQCPSRTPLFGVSIKFSYEAYLNHQLYSTLFVNQTSSNSDGYFNLLVLHPEIEGTYTGIIEL